MNDERIEKIARAKVEEWRKDVASSARKNRYEIGRVNRLIKCADELESLIPALSEAVRQARTDAVQKACSTISFQFAFWTNQGLSASSALQSSMDRVKENLITQNGAVLESQIAAEKQ